MSDPNTDEHPVFSRLKFRFTIGSMLILTTVVAASGMSLNYYVRALNAEEIETEIGMFAIVAAMTPTVFLVVASYFLKAIGLIAKILK